MNKQEELGLSQNAGSGLMPEVTNGKVDARSVHEALEVATPFYTWIKRRVEEFGFVEGDDFFPTDLSGKSHGNRIDYALTLDMAKELAMVERNEMGRRMRRYFIECEKRLRESSPALAGPSAALPSSALSRIQQINAGLIEEMQTHAVRITTLEDAVLPGPEWCGVVEWMLDHPEEMAVLGHEDSPQWRSENRQKFASISAMCVRLSQSMGVASGWVRTPSGHVSRSYRPDIIAAVVAIKIKRMRKGGRS